VGAGGGVAQNSISDIEEPKKHDRSILQQSSFNCTTAIDDLK
jgi:hypothetical protein